MFDMLDHRARAYDWAPFNSIGTSTQRIIEAYARLSGPVETSPKAGYHERKRQTAAWRGSLAQAANRKRYRGKSVKRSW